MTVVFDTVLLAGGRPAAGLQVQLAAGGWTNDGVRTILSRKTPVTISASGRWQADLEVLDDGQYYAITYPDGTDLFAVVPDSPDPVNLTTILVESPAPPSPVVVGAKSINRILPDGQGDITVTAADLGAASVASVTTVQTALTAETNRAVAVEAAKADLVVGVVPRAQLPNITSVFTVQVASQAAMLALARPDADTSLQAVRTDTPGTVFWLNPGLSPAVLGNWLPIADDISGAASTAQAAAIATAAADATTKVANEQTRALAAEAAKAVNGFPSYAPAGLLNRYDPKHNFYNLKGSNTRRMRASLGRSANGGMGQWLIVGDSAGAGCTQAIFAPFTFDRLNAWPLSMGKQLARHGVPVAGTGIIRWVDGTSTTIDARCSSTGAWTNGLAYVTGVANGATLTTTLGAGDFPSIATYTIAEVWYFDSGTTATFTVSVNGAASGAGFASVVMTNTNTWRRVVLTGVAIVAGSTVKVTKTNAVATVFAGVNCYTPDAGLIIHNASQSGATASGAGAAAWVDLTQLGLVYQTVAGAPARTFADGSVTNASPTLTSAAGAAFTIDDVGRPLIRQAAAVLWDEHNYVTAVGSATSVTMFRNAKQTLAGQTVTIGRPPDAVFICLGGNDGPVATTPIATIIAAITTIRNFWPNSDAVLVIEQQKSDTLITPANWEAYCAALYTLADTLDVPLFDFRDRLGNFTTGNGNAQYGDNAAHLVSGAYVDWGKAMANGLVA